MTQYGANYSRTRVTLLRSCTTAFETIQKWEMGVSRSPHREVHIIDPRRAGWRDPFRLFSERAHYA
jgi:hypothetical protein